MVRSLFFIVLHRQEFGPSIGRFMAPHAHDGGAGWRKRLSSAVCDPYVLSAPRIESILSCAVPTYHRVYGPEITDPLRKIPQ